MTFPSFRNGDVVRVVRRTRRGTEDNVVRITSEPEHQDAPCGSGWGFTYGPADHPDTIHDWYGWGFAIIRDTPGKFGIQSIEVIGHEDPKPPPKRLSLVRHPGYDLVH